MIYFPREFAVLFYILWLGWIKNLIDFFKKYYSHHYNTHLESKDSFIIIYFCNFLIICLSCRIPDEQNSEKVESGSSESKLI